MLRTSSPCPCSSLRVVALALLFLLTLAAAPARAGHWVLSAGGSSAQASPYPSPAPWQAPADTSGGSLTLPGEVGGTGNSQTAATGTATMTVSVTGTWTADGQSDDTAPPSVKVLVSSTATSSQNSGGTYSVGPVSDGINANTPDPTTGVVTDQKYITSSTPGSFTVSLGLSASPSASPSQPAEGGPHPPPAYCGVTASVGPVTISIHAQPYDFTDAGAMIEAGGTLYVEYHWASTDGVLSHIGSNCTVHEYVTYDGNPGAYKNAPNSGPAYYPTSPPLATGTSYPNPTDTPMPPQSGSSGFIPDEHYTPGFMKTYSPITYTGTQYFRFSDKDTGQTGQNEVNMPGNVSFPISIVRKIVFQSPLAQPFVYTITVDGHPYSQPLPNQ